MTSNKTLTMSGYVQLFNSPRVCIIILSMCTVSIKSQQSFTKSWGKPKQKEIQ